LRRSPKPHRLTRSTANRIAGAAVRHRRRDEVLIALHIDVLRVRTEIYSGGARRAVDDNIAGDYAKLRAVDLHANAASSGHDYAIAVDRESGDPDRRRKDRVYADGADKNLIAGNDDLRSLSGAATGLGELNAGSLSLNRIVGDDQRLKLVAGLGLKEIDTDRAGYDLVVCNSQAGARCRQDMLGDVAPVHRRIGDAAVAKAWIVRGREENRCVHGASVT
jgi:hypothetical protein